MTFKPNPGCELPTLLLPSLQAYLDAQTKRATDYLAAQTAPAVVMAKRAGLAATRLADEVDARKKSIEEYQKLVESYGKITCPLPDVLDKKATGEI